MYVEEWGPNCSAPCTIAILLPNFIDLRNLILIWNDNTMLKLCISYFGGLKILEDASNRGIRKVLPQWRDIP